jgi:chemotaxis protein methyltransferase CheR
VATLEAPQGQTIAPENYLLLQKIVYDGSGIVLERDKQYLLEARLASIARDRGLGSVNDLCALLKATREAMLHNQMVEAMTTNETYFFRDPAQYDAIRKVLLPELREHRAATRRLSFWSAAASAGQELYSLAMLLLEQGFGDWKPQLFGTDLSSQVLEKARAAQYLQIEVNRGLPAPLLLKYFHKQGLNWQLDETVKRMVRFERVDLRQPMRTFGPFDLVFCRNVLIYFDAATRNKILREIHGTLFRGGWLLLGSAEAPSGLEELFERRSVGAPTVYIAR